MKGPALRVPLWPLALAGGSFHPRPLQIAPSGAMVMCCAMSLHPFTFVW
jgi:hypothetical protein